MKYKLTNETKTVDGITLRRIKALKSFDDVKKGDLGGWIERESNLSREGDAWVSGDALVYGKARVSGNARVFGDAQVFGDARVSGDAWVSGYAWVSGDARVSGTEEPVSLSKSDTLSIGGKKYRLVEITD